MGSITLTNVPQFIEQPGRNIVRNTATLDRMTVPFLGPYNVTPPFAKGSPDTVYPLMFCTGFTERGAGGLTELTVNYAGRIDAHGGKFISEFLAANASSEKELSYSHLESGPISYAVNPVTNSPTGNVYKTCVINYVLRYISTTVTYKYCCYPAPYVMPVGQTVGGKPSNPTITSQYTRYAGSGSATYSPGQPLASWLAAEYPGPFGYVGPIIRETAFSAEPAVGGWYECQVTYDARYEISG